MQYTKEEVSALVSTVEKEFAAHLAKAEETVLAKSEDASPAPEKKDEKAEKPEHKEEPKHEEKPEEKAAPAEHKEEPKAEGKEAPPAAQEHAPAKEGADNQEGHDYDEKDMEHMHQMYASMSRGELKAHHDSVKRALDSHGSAKEEMNMSKSEDVKPVEVTPEVIAVVSPETELLKSELEAQKAKTDGLQKSLDAVSAFLTKLVEKKGAPQAKAITSYDTIAKSEGGGQEEKTLTRSEIDSILLKKSTDSKLEKSDRDAINAFYLADAGINTISHLLK